MSDLQHDKGNMADGRENHEEGGRRHKQEQGQEQGSDQADRIVEEPNLYEPGRVDSRAEVQESSKTAAAVTGENDPKKAEAKFAEEKGSAADEPGRTSEADRLVLNHSASYTRRSFIVAAAAAAAGYAGYRWIDHSRMIGRQQLPLRKAFNTNAEIARDVFKERGIAPTFAKSEAVPDLRFNGPAGLRQEIVLSTWRLKLIGVENPQQYKQYVPDVTDWKYREVADASMANAASGHTPGPTTPGTPAHVDDSKGPAEVAKPGVWTRGLNTDGTPRRGLEEAGVSASDYKPFTPGLLLTLDDIKRLPHQELVTEFKCIEGWSEIVHWGGYRLADLIAAYPPARNAKGELPKYVYMETPYGDYYCGYNMGACTHPQSLLATVMSGAPLTQNHGAPLRLHMPIKYGYKQIKRIALIAYTDKRPDDYWTKLGYDWYAGL